MGFFPRDFFPGTFWPQDFWPDVPGYVADWLARNLDRVADPAASLTLNVVRPGIIDVGGSHFAHGDVFIIGIEEKMKTETTVPSRLATALLKLYGVVRELPVDTAADTVLSRMAETIRRTVLAGNVAGKACDDKALNIDCPAVRYAPGPGCQITVVDVMVRYFLEN
jgi:hypothetical protein